MSFDGNFWLGVAGLGYTAGTFALGKMAGIGKKQAKLENIERGLAEVREEVAKINQSLIGCQRASAESRGQLSTQVDQVESQVEKLQEKTDDHSKDRDVHTDREWRQGQTERLEAIANSIGTRLGNLETNLTNQITAIRNQMKNGSNGNGGGKVA